MHDKLLSMGTGVFLLIFSNAVVVFDTSNFLAFGLAFFVLMIGIMLVMVGALNGVDKIIGSDAYRNLARNSQGALSLLQRQVI